MLHLDYETACDLDLTKVGLDRYSSHPSCRVLMAAYRIGDGQLQQWEQRDGRFPRELEEALLDPAVERWAFNAQFERVISRRVLKIRTPIAGWRCSMCLSYMHSFTGGLEEVGEQMGLPAEAQKQKEGKRLIRLFSMPQTTSRNRQNEWRNWITDPEDWQRFLDYNRQDVVTEEAVKRRLISYPVLDDEWSFYELDQLINDRGMPLDFAFVTNVIAMSQRRQTELTDEMREICGVKNPNSRDQILQWLGAHGYPFGDLQKETVQKALNLSEELWGCRPDVADEDAHPVVRVLRRRQWAARSSVRKGETARRTVGPGKKVRFMYQFLGASRTGRFAGRGVQPQNMTRTPKLLDPEDGSELLDATTDMIRSGDYDGFELFISEPMMAFSGAMRSMFRAPEGHHFVVCDYKSVESAGLGWVAACKRLLGVFENDLDPYLDFGTLFYHKAYDQITRGERQICKPPALGCGYRLSAGKIREDGSKTGLLRYAEGMGVEMSPEDAKLAVTVFRRGYHEVPQFWYDCEEAVHHVLQTGGSFELRHIKFYWRKPYLLIRLPSGRHIYYYKPRLVWRDIPTGNMIWARVDGVMTEVEEVRKRLIFQYYGRDQHRAGAPWRLIDAHGGVTTENIVQALTRDILKVGIQRLHAAGFNIVGHSHDEVITVHRVGDNYYSWETMREIMKEPIEWAPGFPLGAAGWSGPYYRK
jgi:DNA polymerase